MSVHYLTDDLPGVGGVIKQRPEDFCVHEQPLYEPSGQGEHLYLFIEKKGQTTLDVVRRLARAFGVGKGDVGYAGLKDKHAITRQMFSVYLPDTSRDAPGVASLEGSIVRVLWADRHQNKLRRGHHAGNRFAIRIRQVQPAQVLTARAVLGRLSQQGVPNYLGQQRFGIGGVNDRLAVMLLKQQWQEFVDLSLGHHAKAMSPVLQEAGRRYAAGDYAGALEVVPRSMVHDRQMLDALRRGRGARGAVMAIDAQHRDFLVSALQGAVFNAVLSARIEAGTLGVLQAGDLAWKHDSGAVFAVDEATAATENAPGGRVASLAVSPSGPMWGPRMTQAQGATAKAERDALAQWGLTEAELAGGGHVKVQGARRPLRVTLQDTGVAAGADEHGPFIEVTFTLQRGAFATVVLGEIMKNDAAAAAAEATDEQDAPRGQAGVRDRPAGLAQDDGQHDAAGEVADDVGGDAVDDVAEDAADGRGTPPRVEFW